MIKISEIKLPLDSDEGALRRAAAKALHCKEEKIKSIQISKKAVDSPSINSVVFFEPFLPKECYYLQM